MICSNCGTENPAGAKFCTECASRLAMVCPNCGTANVPTAKFCAECASPLGAATPVAASAGSTPIAPAVVAERRVVSVLFADLVGFTTLAEGRDAEDTRELLSHYFDLARDVIGRYGGTVEKFIGDAVMAVWGAPTAHEDDAERAVRAGLELVDAVRTLGPTVQARAGVLTGEAAVTLGATNQGMVAGDLVNTASRLQSAAAPGTVLVGEATRRAASKAIAFEEAGEQTLKGKAAPVPAWLALRVVAQVGGRNRADALEAPFVGRDDELRLLKDLFHATTRERRARLVSVIGPAGIGKTRLAWEFLKYVDGLVDTVWWHDGRSPAYGEGISFWALGEMVRGRTGLLETDDEATTRAKIAATLLEHVPDPDERRWIEPALLALLGVETGIGSEQLFGAWRTFFERLAATAPVVLVFEDFHFADSGLIDFVDHLVEWSKGFPIYVVTLARPELLERRSEWGAGKRSFTSLYLEPLPEAAMRELLTGLVPGLPAAAVKAIIARADGIPLYAVETVRMLVAEGRLAIAEGTYRPVGDLTSLAVPETLTALIASRLDTLEPTDRSLLHDAAVIGQSFTPAALASVSGVAEADLEPRLRVLVKRELLTPATTDPRSPERGQYAFVQALIREVAYGTLAKADRKAKHLAAARFFEGLGSDELAGALASHYLAAYQNAPAGPEAEALASQARLALRGAAERAAALGANDQALRFLDQAISVTTDPEQQAELLERAGDAAELATRYGDAEAYLRRAIRIHRDVGDRTAATRATALLGKILLGGRRVDQARDILAQAAAEFADLAGDPAFITLEGQLARTYFFLNEDRRAIEVADHVLEEAERADLVAILADTLITRGSALANLGRWREGLGVIEIGERLARDNGFTHTLLRALNNRSINGYLDDPARAMAAAAEGLVLARRVGDMGLAVGYSVGLAWDRLYSAEWDDALALVGAFAQDDQDPLTLATLMSVPFCIRAFRGEDLGPDLALLDQVLPGMSDRDRRVATFEIAATRAWGEGRLAEARAAWRSETDVDPTEAKWGLPQAARAALLLRDPAATSADLEALDATGLHGALIELHRRTIRAGLAALDGREDEALAMYRAVLKEWRELGLLWQVALVGLDMATLLDPADPDVQAAIASSREIMTRVGARPFLERLEAAAARSLRAQLPGRAGVSVVDRHAGVGQSLPDQVGG